MKVEERAIRHFDLNDSIRWTESIVHPGLDPARMECIQDPTRTGHAEQLIQIRQAVVDKDPQSFSARRTYQVGPVELVIRTQQ